MADIFQRLSVFGVIAEWEAVKNAEQAKDVISQQLSAESAAAANSQPETFNQQVTMMPVQVLKAHSRSVQSFLLEEDEPYLLCFYLPPLQLPVAQAVPSAVGLVPPAFPVSMGIPPPGYGPPPFIRPGFNASQPPPGRQNNQPEKVLSNLREPLKPSSSLQGTCRQHRGEACPQLLLVRVFDIS